MSKETKVFFTTTKDINLYMVITNNIGADDGIVFILAVKYNDDTGIPQTLFGIVIENVGGLYNEGNISGSLNGSVQYFKRKGSALCDEYNRIFKLSVGEYDDFISKVLDVPGFQAALDIEGLSFVKYRIDEEQVIIGNLKINGDTVNGIKLTNNMLTPIVSLPSIDNIQRQIQSISQAVDDFIQQISGKLKDPNIEAVKYKVDALDLKLSAELEDSYEQPGRSLTETQLPELSGVVSMGRSDRLEGLAAASVTNTDTANPWEQVEFMSPSLSPGSDKSSDDT